MFCTVRRLFSKIPTRAYALWAELVLIIFGTVLVIFDLSFNPDPKYAERYADFFIYLALGGVIAMWSVFGVMATWKRWRKGINIYFYLLIILDGIQICFGILHIILLFTLYRQRHVDFCLSNESDHFFWLSLGYSNDDEVKALTDHCLQHWSRFALQRTLTWAVFSLVLVFCTILINRYHVKVKHAHRNEIQATGWPDMEDNKPMVTVVRGDGDNANESRNNGHPPSAPSSEKLAMPSPPPNYWESQHGKSDSNNSLTYQHSHNQQLQQQEYDYFSQIRQAEEDDTLLYRRRDRLHSEIARQRDHQNYQHSSHLLSSAASTSEDNFIHPLDLRRKSAMSSEEQQQLHDEDNEDEFGYRPPSPPPPRLSIDNDKITSSSEKMDYDLFRSRPHRLSVVHADTTETITMSRRRNKPQWFQEEHHTLLEDNDDADHIDDGSSNYKENYKIDRDDNDIVDDKYERAYLRD
ncbi:hypothetical protein BDC45DRAFT_50790 [Circinella umbellata]|nr:hypothetical protein BDC45DRAFT_50790 [Circinella umbellata]